MKMISAVCVALVVFLVGSSIVFTDAKLFNSLLWRLESYQAKPVTSQLIYERQLQRHYLGLDAALNPGAVLFFGDSIVQLMPTNEFVGAVNFAIGGEAIERLALRLAQYKSLNSASAVVINGGANDLFEGRTPAQIEASWLLVLQQLETRFQGRELKPRIICLGLAGESFAELNQKIRTACEKNSAHYLNPTPSSTAGFASDKIHLSPAGYRSLVEQLKALLTTIRYHGATKKESAS
jgi:hypothetical protein